MFLITVASWEICCFFSTFFGHFVKGHISALVKKSKCFISGKYVSCPIIIISTRNEEEIRGGAGIITPSPSPPPPPPP